MIFVTDELDYRTTTPSDWEDWFADIQIDRAASVHGFLDPVVSTNLASVVATFGGIDIDAGTSDWGPGAESIAAAISPPAAFDGTVALADLPDPATIVVTATEPGGAATELADGVDYVYDAKLNAIVLTGYVPIDGTEILVEYRALP